MSRYIDADATKLAVIKATTYGDALRAVKEQPSIDIVRCVECKYEPICIHSVQHTTHELTSVTIGYKSVDFCSYGERREQ